MKFGRKIQNHIDIELENVAIANPLQLEAASATPVFFRFNPLVSGVFYILGCPTGGGGKINPQVYLEFCGT